MYGCGYPSYGYSYGANGFWIIIVVLIIFFILFWNNGSCGCGCGQRCCK
ncbi:MAG: sporulation protein YjcZ [Bacilli bacterium]|nr:sporulation protein YjcZ [Bacilli bacterium]